MQRAPLVLALVLLTAPAFGQGPRPPAPPTVLHLTQSAERRLARDTLHVELRAEETGGDAQAVESAINQSMAKALGQARQVFGIEIETGSYTVNRQPEHNPPEWIGNQTLSLSGTDAEALLKLAGGLQAQGLVMSNLYYATSPKAVHATEDALTAEALNGLDRRAATIAQQLRLTVLGYRELTVGNAQLEGGSMPRVFANQATTAAALPTPVAAPGEATVRITINADVVLGPRTP